MFSFIATIVSLTWITQHITEVIFFAALIIFIIVSMRNHAAKRAAAARMEAEKEAEKRQKINAANAAIKQMEEEKAAAAARAAEEETHTLTVNIPDEIDGKQLTYHYEDVKIDTTEAAKDDTFAKRLTFFEDGDRVGLLLDGVNVGYLPQNRLSGMARDWLKSGDPYVAYLANRRGDEVTAFLGFYTDTLQRFMKKNPDAKLFKLVGKPEEFAFYSKGNKCEIEKDYDSEKYQVICNECVIGKLPVSAVSYAEKHEIDPEDLDVIIGEVDYDIEKDRDIISVYISD